MFKQSAKRIAAVSTTSARSFTVSKIIRAKGDSSTIDSFRLPSQTSINEWEFKYDFIPKTEQKVPLISREAVKQDIAHEKAKSVERELFTKESNSSHKVEANEAHVVHGGEAVSAAHELHEDRGNSKPIDISIGKSQQAGSSKPKKSANHDKYIQSSVNPKINDADVVNLGNHEIDHKIEEVVEQSPVVDDIEHDNLNSSK
ncbi:hypothetical protein KGF56_004362 [Candida oxycetoniae]|uniref:Uncharacterized protein n=1 Tax=Candida oxycetoniae TaxID=497107 RepID=A0AAI9WW84_9ASCO|nr:uncharacterized protein KGF56_004362 [Candida oxycetoniae]KAI3402901.1 hypothetical protein KGF56_004362 [Candida oxycetoniae]